MRTGGRRAVLVVFVVVALAGVGVAAASPADTATGNQELTTAQDGSVAELTVDAAFVGTVADEEQLTVEASGVTDGGAQLDGVRVTVTVGGEPAGTAEVENGAFETAVDPATLDLDPQEGVEVGVHGFAVEDPPTVEVVHEALALDAGYNLHSVPQGAALSVEGVDALNVWDGFEGTYDAVTESVFETPDDLNRALYIAGGEDDARLGYSFTDEVPTPGEEELAAGWNFLGSNFDISESTEQTLDDDLVGIDAAEQTVFAADFSEELEPDDPVGAYEGYWVLAEEELERAVLSPTYDRTDRADTLGVGESDFQIPGVDVTTGETDAGGVVEVTATVENQGDALDTQFVDLLADDDGEFELVERTGVELDEGESETVTMVYEVGELKEFDVQVVTDNDDIIQAVSWDDDPFFAVSDLDAPAQVEEGESVDVSATVNNTGGETDTQDVVFNLDPFGNFDDPAVQVVAEEDLTLEPGDEHAVDLTVDAPEEAGEFEHGVFTDDDSQTAALVVGETQVEAGLGTETVTLGAGAATTFTVDFDIESLDEATERDVRAYELDVSFDPEVVAFEDATLAEFPDSAELVVNEVGEGHVRLVGITTEETMTPVTAAELEFEAVAAGETDLTIDPAESNVEGPSGAARLPTFADGSVVVESGQTTSTSALGAGGSPLVGSSSTPETDSLVRPSLDSPVELTGDSTQSSADEVRLDSPGETRELTLVTGHTVTVLGEGEDRRFIVEGPDGEDAAYTTVEREAETLIRPAGVDMDLYSEALFNIDLLLEQGYTDEHVEGTPVIVDLEVDDEFSTTRGSAPDRVGFEGFEQTGTLDLIDAVAGVATGEVDFAAANDLSGVSGVFLDAQHEVALDEADEAIDAPAAREAFDVDGSGVDIAILDTGIDDHPDFGDRIVDEVDFTGDGVADRQGHGTHVAGIAAGDGAESDGEFVGIAPGANLMNVKVLDDAGSGSISGIVDGVEYAVDNDADIISMSLGGPVQVDDPLVDAVEEATDEDISVVVSAGNSGTNTQTISSPGTAESAITVGATEEPYDEVAFFSSAGPTPNEQRVKPEVVAPGFPITATGSDDAGEFPYTAKGGTSMSAPAVSGLSALVMEEHGDLEPGELEDRLVTTADPLSGEFENDIYRQGSGQVNATAALDTDIVVRDSVQSIGVVEDPTEETLVYQVENVGDETVELDSDVLVYNVEEAETLDNADLNETTLTVDPGETAGIEVTLDIEDSFGLHSGILTFEGETESYRATFGYSRGLEVTVEKMHNERNTNPGFGAIQVFSSDGTFEFFEFDPFMDSDEYSFILPAGSEELNIWTQGEYEDIEDPDAFSEVALTFEEGVPIDQDNTDVLMDERQTVPREVDTSAVSEDEPFNTEEFTVFAHANTTATDIAYGIGGFGEQAHFTELEPGTATNISTSWALVPEDEVGEEPLDSPRIYTVVGATETLDPEDPDYEIDPDTFATENMTLHRLDEEFYDASLFLSPADQETFPGAPPFAIREDIGADREQIEWIRNADGQYEHVFGAGEVADYRYVGAVWSPDPGEEVETDVNAGPFVPNSDWTIDDRLDMRMSFAAGPGDRTRMAGVGTGPLNELRVDIDDETVIDDEVPAPGVTIDGPIGPDTDVAVELEGNSMVNRSTFTSAKYTGNSDDPAPPNVESVDVLGYGPNEPITDAEVTVEVELDSPGGLEPRLFRAYHAHDAFDRPTEDWRSWSRGDIEFVGDGVFHVDIPVDPAADELDLAFRALDEHGNGMEVATFGAVPVDLDLAIHPDDRLIATTVAAGGVSNR